VTSKLLIRCMWRTLGLRNRMLRTSTKCLHTLEAWRHHQAMRHRKGFLPVWIHYTVRKHFILVAVRYSDARICNQQKIWWNGLSVYLGTCEIFPAQLHWKWNGLTAPNIYIDRDDSNKVLRGWKLSCRWVCSTFKSYMNQAGFCV
jgi:hypothetical protein